MMFQAHLYFLGPRLRQNHISKDPCFLFFWKWYLQRIRALICSLWLGSQFSRELGHTHSYNYIYFCISTFVYVFNHGFMTEWYNQFQWENKAHSRLFLSLSISALSNNEKSYLLYIYDIYLWYIHLVVQTQYTQKVVSELLPIPLWERI